MNKETIIRWAREAGLLHESDTAESISECGVEMWLSPSDGVNTFERFATLAYAAGAKDENEACAKLADKEAAEWFDNTGIATFIANAIRARGNT